MAVTQDDIFYSREIYFELIRIVKIRVRLPRVEKNCMSILLDTKGYPVLVFEGEVFSLFIFNQCSYLYDLNFPDPLFFRLSALLFSGICAALFRSVLQTSLKTFQSGRSQFSQRILQMC